MAEVDGAGQVGVGPPAVAPVGQEQQHRAELLPGVGEVVLVTWGAFGVRLPTDEAGPFELPQPGGQDVAGGAGGGQHLPEPVPPVHQVAEHVHRPPPAQDAHRVGYRAAVDHWFIVPSRACRSSAA